MKKIVNGTVTFKVTLNAIDVIVNGCCECNPDAFEAIIDSWCEGNSELLGRV